MLQWLEPNSHEHWAALTGLSALETQMEMKLGTLYGGGGLWEELEWENEERM